MPVDPHVKLGELLLNHNIKIEEIYLSGLGWDGYFPKDGGKSRPFRKPWPSSFTIEDLENVERLLLQIRIRELRLDIHEH